MNSSINFEWPHWLNKKDKKEHPQFKFLRENAKFFGVIPYHAKEKDEVDEQFKKDK